MKTPSVGVLALFMAPLVVWAQVVENMAPDRIREAIKCGRALAADSLGKGYALTIEQRVFRDRRGPGALFSMHTFGWGPEALVIDTPFSRVCLAAAEAARERRPFSSDQVTPEMVAPVLHVYQPGFLVGGTPVSYKHMVVARGEGEQAELVEPFSIEPTTESWQAAPGTTIQTHGVRAVFPLSVLTEGYEFRLIRDNGAQTAEPMTKKALASIR